MGMGCEQTAKEKLTEDCAFGKGHEFSLFPQAASFYTLT